MGAALLGMVCRLTLGKEKYRESWEELERVASAMDANRDTLLGLVDVGRNIYGLGTPDDSAAGWRIGVLHPETGEVMRVLTLRDAAVATSSNAEQSVTLDGERVGHLLDARAGLPAHARRSATVTARNATEADAGSTLAFLLGRQGTACLPDVTGVEWLA